LWCATVELDRTSDGKRRRKVVAAKTKKEALDKATALRADLEAGRTVVNPHRSTGDYLDDWLDTTLPNSGVKASTVASYRDIVTYYIMPAIGGVPLAKLEPGHVDRMLADLAAAGRSARTRQYARAVLRRALTHAERRRLVRYNAAKMVDGPRAVGSRADDTLTADEARKVLAAAAGDRLEALAVILLTLGLRRGEALALRWADVDLERGELRITGTLRRETGRGLVIDSAKTLASERTIPLVPRPLEALRAHRDQEAAARADVARTLGQAVDDQGFVFSTLTMKAGELTYGPIDPRNALRWWQNLTERAGVGRRRMHDARHTAATLLLEDGVPLEVVSAVLGHAGLAITADVYAKVGADAKRRALSAHAERISL
jgi:integrase